MLCISLPYSRERFKKHQVYFVFRVIVFQILIRFEEFVYIAMWDLKEFSIYCALICASNPGSTRDESAERVVVLKDISKESILSPEPERWPADSTATFRI